MKKSLIILAVVCLIVFGASFVYALENGIIDINLSGTKEISPNAFQLSFAVETQNTDVQKAISEIKKIPKSCIIH